MSSKKKKAKPDVSLLAYFWGSIIGFGGCAILFGYFAFSQKLWSLLIFSAACLLPMIVLLFYNKIFVDHPAEITEIGVKIGKKVTRWEDIEQVWPETIWTGRGEPHMFACFLIKEAARTKKKPKNARFDFRIPVNDENMKLLEQYMEVSEGRIS